jgi:hypothetical protein
MSPINKPFQAHKSANQHAAQSQYVIKPDSEIEVLVEIFFKAEAQGGEHVTNICLDPRGASARSALWPARRAERKIEFRQ